jgi:hypothetical protein
LCESEDGSGVDTGDYDEDNVVVSESDNYFSEIECVSE